MYMKHEVALYFRDQMRTARAAALRDAEAFQEIVFVLERLGSFLTGNIGNLGKYGDAIQGIAAKSPMATLVPLKLQGIHTSFEAKYRIVREARNSALHEGALARHLTINAIELSLVLEEALMAESSRILDFMVSNPVCAYLWQPLSLIRQTMLVNSFSFLPVPVDERGETAWRLVSDIGLAQYLRVGGKVSTDRVSQKLEEAVDSGAIELLRAETCRPQDEIKSIFEKFKSFPLLVPSPDNRQLMGILTAFDLL
jgi:hypothetical protein